VLLNTLIQSKLFGSWELEERNMMLDSFFGSGFTFLSVIFFENWCTYTFLLRPSNLLLYRIGFELNSWIQSFKMLHGVHGVHFGVHYIAA
jgi:hypothetical protein